MMQSFTKAEIAWTVCAVEQMCKEYQAHADSSALAALRAEQLVVIAEKLRRTIEAGNRRIEIRY